ncbi:MAG: hemerythrin domain-containing protein [Myxococcales bacterium]|nr:hemerythrin domain-containing protein [Myxococcales bacterium]
MPKTLTEFAASDHKHCDQLWADVEAAEGDDAACLAAWKAFTDAMERHFKMEEEVMFPAFEQATGMHGGGPTAVMRMEHKQMRGVMATMAAAADDGDFELLIDHGDTLMMLIAQHNVKEENMLYPMSQRAIGAGWSAMHGDIEQRFGPFQ